jgi:hypothetical protein
MHCNCRVVEENRPQMLVAEVDCALVMCWNGEAKQRREGVWGACGVLVAHMQVGSRCDVGGNG